MSKVSFENPVNLEHFLGLDAMPRPTARQRVGRGNSLKHNRTLVVCCPCYSDWASDLVARAREKQVGELLVHWEELPKVRDLLSFLQRQVEEGQEYNTVVVVPGHGNEPTYVRKKKGKLEIVRSTPYLVWHEKGTERQGDVLIQGTRLNELLRLCADLAKHVHLGTCYQGCMLDLHYKRLRDDQLARRPRVIISGWRKGLMLDDRGSELLGYILRGCPCRMYRWGTSHGSHFAYIPF